MRDGLTKLWNRRAILQLLEEELHRSLREQKSLGVILLDIDNFKTINDMHGHIIGDTVLVEVASRLEKEVF